MGNMEKDRGVQLNMDVEKGLCIRAMGAAKLDMMRNLMYALTKQGNYV